jgi:DNA polymerase elongation subunit (family B)
MIAYSSGINVDDALGTVKPWGIYISNQAYLDKLILPNDSGNPEYNGVIGGWVADPKKGKHNWIVSFDFASLYPSIMRWCNMSPETFVTEDKMHDDLKKIRDKILFLDSNFTSNDVNIKSPSPWSSRESYFMKWIDNREILDKVGKILQKHNVSAGINGAFFRNDKLGIVPRLVKELYGQRKKAKKDMFVHSQNIQDLIAKGFSSSSPEIKHEEKMVAFFDTKQMAMKIRLNSLYGALANKHFVLFNEEIAAAITANGRVSNQITAWEISRYTMDNYGYDSMLAGDTDSSYHTLSPIVNQYVKENPNVTKDDIVTFCSDFCEEKLQPVINETLAELSTYLNCYEPEAQAMDREIVADSGFFVAKKKYVARVLDVEGVRLTSPKLKVMGLEIVRSSTPALCRKKLKESIEIILDKEEHEVQEYIKEVKEEFYNAPLEDISRVSGVSKINYDLHTSKSIPINSRASIVHNLLVEKLDLGNSYEPITPADKIKYVMLRTPNPASNQDVVAYKDVRFIEESGLSKYVNRDVMFEKFFMSPMNIMLEPIGWSGEKQPSFDEWE